MVDERIQCIHVLRYKDSLQVKHDTIIRLEHNIYVEKH